MTNLYSFSAKSLQGESIDLSHYANQVLLVVNVASECGFTPQYTGLEALYRQYHDKGFSVLAFPCNQFGRQEPGDPDQIAAFCSTNYGVSFPMRSEEHTSELQSLMRISYAVFCLKKKKTRTK